MGSTRNTLAQALEALQRGDTPPDVRRQADRWLEEFQGAAEAWQVADGLLHDPASPLELQYFGAQTLRTKVQRDFEELPPDAAASLRESLVVLLLKFSGGPAAVRTQLCIAIAAMAAHLPAERWDGKGCLRWAVDRMSAEPPERALPCLLQFLIVLPQEAGAYRQAVRPDRRRQFVAELSASTPEALNAMTSCLQVPNVPRLQEQLLAAYASWVHLAVQGEASSADRAAAVARLNPGSLAQHPLTVAALEGLHHEETFDSAVDAVSELVRLTQLGNESGQEVAEPMLPLVQLLVSQVMGLKERFSRAAATARGEDVAGPPCEDDDESAKGMARLFAEVGEAYTDLISRAAPESVAPAEALLEVSAYPDNDVAATSFNFFFQLSRALTTRAEGVDPAEMERRKQMFEPAFVKLVQNIQGRVRYPDGYEGWRRDQRRDFKMARAAVGDTLQDAAMLLGGARVLQLLSEPLSALATAVAAGQPFDWRGAEAALYCIRSVAKAAPPTSDQLLPSLLASLAQLPTQPQLLYTTALTVGAYADWVAAAQQTGLLPSLFSVLTNALSAPRSEDGELDAQSAGALALKKLCAASAAHLGPYMDSLLGIYNQAVKPTDGIEGAPASALDPNDALEIVEGLALAVAALPPEQAKAGLQVLLSPIAGGLTNAVPEAVPPGAPEPTGPVIMHADRLATVFRFAGHPDLVAEALTALWPLISRALDRCVRDEMGGERICRAIKYAQRTAGRRCAPVMLPFANSLQGLFKARRHASLLFAASELVRTFAGDAAASQGLQPILESLFTDAAATLRTMRDFDAHPDVADDTFLLACKCLAHCPPVMYSPTMLPLLLDLSIIGAHVQHREACVSLHCYLNRLLQDRDPAALGALQQVLTPRGPALGRSLVASVAGMLPASRLPEVADVVFELLRLCAAAAVEWLGGAIAQLPDVAASPSDRQNIMGVLTAVAQGQATHRQLTTGLDELSELCRRSRRSRDACQQLFAEQQPAA